jgi:hypothetical protein
MNGFVLYFQAKIRLKYDRRSPPKNPKNAPCAERRKEDCAHGGGLIVAIAPIARNRKGKVERLMILIRKWPVF